MTATKKDLKKSAVNKLGGECINCGYKRCLAALHFHHINKWEKEFNISEKSNWYDISCEIKKCMLLCSNCHAEIHENMLDEELLWEFQEEARKDR